MLRCSLLFPPSFLNRKEKRSGKQENIISTQKGDIFERQMAQRQDRKIGKSENRKTEESLEKYSCPNNHRKPSYLCSGKTKNANKPRARRSAPYSALASESSSSGAHLQVAVSKNCFLA